MSRGRVGNTLIGLEAFVAVMVIYGGIRLLVDAAGFGVREEWLLALFGWRREAKPSSLSLSGQQSA